MGLNSSSGSSVYHHPLETYVFPEIEENSGVFPPQSADAMKAPRNLGPSPAGLNNLDDLPIWRVQGEAVLVVYRYVRNNDGTIVRHFVSCKFIGSDNVQDKFLKSNKAVDTDPSRAHIVRQTEARLIANW
jgi:hypothetical protein